MQHGDQTEARIAVLSELGSGRSGLGRFGRGVRLLLALLLVVPQPAFAATIVVNETTCTLADAITAANTDAGAGGCPAGAGADTIELAADVSLTSALPILSSDITLEGGGFTVARTGGPGFSVLTISSGTFTLNEATVRGGDSSYGGGGVYISGGTSVTITNSTLTENSSAIVGGAVGAPYFSATDLFITNSTLSGNSSQFGGAVYPGYNPTTIITNSTITGNTATSGYLAGGGGGGFFYQNVLISNTIIAGNTPTNCDGYSTPTDGGNNFSDDASCGGGLAAITPGVDFDTTLADNGGPTETHALLAGSVAIDAAGVCGLPADQRGFLRDDGACDSGAYEFDGTPPPGIPMSSPWSLLLLGIGLLAVLPVVVSVRRRREYET